MRLVLAILLLAALLAGARPAPAHEPGDIGIVFDPVTLDQCTLVPGFSVLELYIVIHEAGPIQAWESGLSKDPAFSILEVFYTGPAPTNSGGPENYIVDLGGCVDAAGDHLLATIRGGYFVAPTAPELFFCLYESDPSRVGGGRPAYVDCSGIAWPAGLMNQGSAYFADGCAVANPITYSGNYYCPLPVPVEPMGLGPFKARYGERSPER